MTDRSTAVRLARLGLPHARARAGAVLLASLGIAGALAGLGVWLAPHVAGVLGAWIAIVAVVAVAVWGTRRAQRATTPPALGRRAGRWPTRARPCASRSVAPPCGAATASR